MTDSWELRRPGHFTVGAVGEPGQRVFYFQAMGEERDLAVKCEKQQALALAEHLRRLLDDLPGDDGPAEAAEALPPGELAWTVGSISIGLDRDDARIVVLLEELVLDEAGEPLEGEGSRLRVHLSRDLAASYLGQAARLVAASRPPCRLCDQPIDPSGHACPRLN